MYAVKILITAFVDDSFPGWVECKFADAFRRDITFIEKAPVVTAENLRTDSLYPQVGVIACRVVGRRRDGDGRAIVTIDTCRPWGIESTTGETRFEVFASQLTKIARV
jgi:hypothetical protein